MHLRNYRSMGLPKHSSDWNRARSSFSHAWLKNRFIVALDRLAQVLDGLVEDGCALSDLRERMEEWPGRLHQGRVLLEEHSRFEERSRMEVCHYLPNASVEVIDYCVAVIEARAKVVSPHAELLRTASSRLDSLDEVVRSLQDRLRRQPARGRGGWQVSGRELSQVRARAAELASAFSALRFPAALEG